MQQGNPSGHISIEEAAQEFLAHVQATRAPRTAQTYATGLHHFTRYLEEQGLAPQLAVALLDKRHVIDFIPWLYEHLLENVAGQQPEKISESTKNTYFAAVNGFYGYLIVDSGQLEMDMAEYDALRKALARATRLQVKDELPPDKLPTVEIIAALRMTARQEPNLAGVTAPGERSRQHLAWLRNIAMIESLVSSGMRVGELVRLERGHLLHPVQGALVKYAKRNKEREVLFSAAAWEAIQAYLKARSDTETQKQISSLPVFARHDRRSGKHILPLSTRSVQLIFFNLAQQSGILEQFHLTPHTLRHFFATEFLSQTGDLALTQYALGHTTPTTTRIYAQTRREDYRSAHKQVFRSNKPE